MKMALQVGGTIVIDNNRNLVNIAGGTVPNATNAATLTTSGFSISESGGKLLFKFGSTTIASMNSAGVFTSVSDITAGGAP